MFKLRSRQQLRDYILQELGAPVINVELDVVHLDNAINKAINYFIDRHDDGIEEIFIQIPVDDFLREDGYIELDDEIVGIHSILDATRSGTTTSTSEQLENLHHLVANSDIFTGKSINMGRMVNYVRSRQSIENIKYFFTPFYDFEYNKVTNRLHFRNDLTNINMLGVIVYRAIDPSYDVDIFNDEWIKRYATALAHRQWGVILDKYDNMNMPGAGNINGAAILAEGKELVADALEEFSERYEVPPMPRVE